MTTVEDIVAQDVNVACTKRKMHKMGKVKRAESSDEINYRPSKEKEKKKKHKTQILEEEIGFDVEAPGQKDELSHKENTRPDDKKEKKKKKYKTHILEAEIGFNADALGKEDKINHKESLRPNDKKEKKKKHKTRILEEETGIGFEALEKKDQRNHKEEAKWSEVLDEKNHKRWLDSGKNKRNNKQKTHVDDLEDCIQEDKGEEEKTTPCRINEQGEKGTKSDNSGSRDKNVQEGSLHKSQNDKKRKKKTESEKLVLEDEEHCSEGSCLHLEKKKKRKKSKLKDSGSKEKIYEDGTECGELGVMAHVSERFSPKGSSKRVSFSDEVEIFSLDNDQSGRKSEGDDGLVRGKRFSIEEDELVKKAVLDYIEVHRLGDEGLNMVLHCKNFPELKNCWKDIGAALPWRPYSSVYYRAHILFERGEQRKWTPEEYEIVRKFYKNHGSDWKVLADALGKHRFHVKDTWRRIKLPNQKKGHWSQDEYQNLFDLVNTDLRQKAFEEKISKHGMLRDNICWGAISDKLSTRSYALCCQKWYKQLMSPMVAAGEWADLDDYRLLDALSRLDAFSMESVEWDHLLEHRDGDVCRKRWSQMVKHIGEHGNKSFAEQVEILSNRYCLDVHDAREAYDSGPIVD